MAKINEQTITFKLSKLERDSAEPKPILDDEMIKAIYDALAEMAGPNVLIELE